MKASRAAHPSFLAAPGDPWIPHLQALHFNVVCVEGWTPRDGDPLPLVERLARGERLEPTLRRVVEASAVSAGGAPRLMLDQGGAGLLFTRSPGSDVIRPLHEALGCVLVSRLDSTLLPGLSADEWRGVWTCLLGRSWVKVVSERTLARELVAFGVPNVVHVAAGCDLNPAVSSSCDARGGAEPAAGAGREGTCILVTGTRSDDAFSDASLTLNVAGLFTGVLTSWAEADAPGTSFFDLYHEFYRMGEAPSDGATWAQTAAAAQRYFALKRFYVELKGLARGARFLPGLKRRFGERLIEAHGCRLTGRSPANVRDAIHVALNAAGRESAPDDALLRIVAAGGLLLAHASTGIDEWLRPGQECFVFRTEAELHALIEALIASPKQRRRVARNGRQRVLNRHLLRGAVESFIPRLMHLLARPAADLGRAGVPDRSDVPRVADSPDPRDSRNDARPPPSEPGSRCDARCVPHDGGGAGLSGGGSSPSHAAPPVAPSRVALPPKLLVLQNPGRVSRFYLQGMARGAEELGIEVRVVELGEAWSKTPAARSEWARQTADLVRDAHIEAVIGYTYNGIVDLPLVRRDDGSCRGLFAELGVPHLLFWTDHPQWAHERAALQAPIQPLLRQVSHTHVVKASYAADEIAHFLDWPGVIGMPVGEDVELIQPRRDVTAEFDVVFVTGSPPYLPPELGQFVEEDRPDDGAILATIALRTSSMLREFVKMRAPDALHDKLTRFVADWVDAKRNEPDTAAFRHFRALRGSHTDAAEWLRNNPLVYFDALHAMWEFGRWQRTFLALYLSRFFRVGVFGNDWSKLGLEGDADWVGYEQQSAAYARGKVALNVNQCNDEEGLSHKAFQITASGVPCLHVNRPGIAECFTPGVEMEVFRGMHEAREKLADLLASDPRRVALGEAGLRRTRRDHTWARRLEFMLPRLRPILHEASSHRALTASTVPLTADMTRADRPMIQV